MIIILLLLLVPLLVAVIYLGRRAYVLAGLLADAQDIIDDTQAYISQLEETNKYMFSKIEASYQSMQQIDRLGAFEKDDEAGTTFQMLQQVITELKTEFDDIYRRFIYPALMKLTENIINKMKPDYIDSSFADLQTDLVTHVTSKLDKFKPESGKAYSYYTRTSFNYLIAENQKAYSKLKNDTEELDVDEQRNVLIEIHNDEMRETLKYFMDAYVRYCYQNLNFIFNTQSDIHVADSILHIFESRENVDDFNKKALYILIRERTGLVTNNITRVVKILKDIYVKKFNEYERNNFVNLPF